MKSTDIKTGEWYEIQVHQRKINYWKGPEVQHGYYVTKREYVIARCAGRWPEKPSWFQFEVLRDPADKLSYALITYPFPVSAKSVLKEAESLIPPDDSSAWKEWQARVLKANKEAFELEMKRVAREELSSRATAVLEIYNKMEEEKLDEAPTSKYNEPRVDGVGLRLPFDSPITTQIVDYLESTLFQFDNLDIDK